MKEIGRALLSVPLYIHHMHHCLLSAAIHLPETMLFASLSIVVKLCNLVNYINDVNRAVIT